MRIAAAKSTLKKRLQVSVSVSSRLAMNADSFLTGVPFYGMYTGYTYIRAQFKITLIISVGMFLGNQNM